MGRRGLLAILLVCLVNAKPQAAERASATALAAKIDQLIEAQWKQRSIQPAPLADDSEFLRRIYLDLTGRIPRVSEVREFLDDKAADKRAKLVDRLLHDPRYVFHLNNTWRAIILPPNNNQLLLQQQPAFKTWLDRQVQENVPYDRMVRELLTTAVQPGAPVRAAVAVGAANTPSPAAFYQLNEFKPENLASATTRTFLGVRLECAQCHDHPFAKWTRTQFWEFAAFFSAIQPIQPAPGIRGKEPPKRFDGRSIKIPGKDQVVQARYLDGQSPDWNKVPDSRGALASWITSKENPYFAQTGANRIWGHFFGIGIIDPVDDEAGEDNPPSHPELLAELTKHFVAHDFDIKQLISAVLLSKTYQRTSEQTHASQADPRTFARMPLRGMTPEQLFDSLAQATGYNEPPVQGNVRFVAVARPGDPRSEFLARFASQDRKTETQTSILQALALMNGKFVADATSVERSTTFAAVADAPFLSTEQKIETLYLATLSRMPRAEELARMTGYVTNGGPRSDPRSALSDVFWMLLNSSEFILNH